MVFQHDEPLASRNMRCDPFHKVVSTLLELRHTMRQITATHCGDKSLSRCDKSLCLNCCCDKAACAYVVAAICRTNSNQFEFM